VLRLPPPTRVTAAAKPGESVLRLADTSGLAADTVVHICPPTKEDVPAGAEHYLPVKIASVEKGAIHTAEPLPVAVPEQSRLGYGHNVFDLYGPQKNIVIRDLTIDGGRDPAIPMPNHNTRCAILAQGKWAYKDGPLGPPLENLQVRNCQIRNCYGRAVALYAVVRSQVADCVIDNIGDEGIDFDHFCRHCAARRNRVSHADTGVTLNDASSCVVEDNRFDHCDVGLTVWWFRMCPQTDIDIENILQRNTVRSPKTVGISIGQRCYRNEVRQNDVEGGIRVLDPENVVEDNVLR
jgi:hypothetical protein